MKRENELNYFGVKFWNGILIGFAIEKYPAYDRVELCFYLPFIKIAWVKEMADDEEADHFLNN